MAEIHSFLEGLFGGVASGWASGMMKDRQEQLDREKSGIDLVSKLVQQGHYSVVGMLDPKILKGMFGESADTAKSIFSNLAGLEQQRNKLELDVGQERLAGAKVARQGAEQQQAEQQATAPLRRRQLEAQATTAEATAGVAPRVAGAEARKAETGATAAEKELEALPEKIKQQQDLAKQQIEEVGQRIGMNKVAIQEQQAKVDALGVIKQRDPEAWLDMVFPSRLENKVRQQQIQINEGKLEEAKMLREELAKMPEQMRLMALFPSLAQLDSKKQEMARQALVEVDRVYATRLDKNRTPVPFEREEDAAAFEARLNLLQNRFNKVAPSEAIQWRKEKVATGIMGYGAGAWIVSPHSVGESGSATGAIATPSNPTHQRLNEMILGKGQSSSSSGATEGATTSTSPSASIETPAKLQQSSGTVEGAQKRSQTDFKFAYDMSVRVANAIKYRESQPRRAIQQLVEGGMNENEAKAAVEQPGVLEALQENLRDYAETYLKRSQGIKASPKSASASEKSTTRENQIRTPAGKLERGRQRDFTESQYPARSN